MTRTYPEDRRYMTFEQRAVDDARYRGKVERGVAIVETCYCGKTVVAARGRRTGAVCPRDCEQNRSRR